MSCLMYGKKCKFFNKKLAFLFIHYIFKPHLGRDDSAFLFGIYEE